MKRQLKHMIKHKYVPWTAGKKKFQGKDDKGDVSFDSKRVKSTRDSDYGFSIVQTRSLSNS